MGQDIVGIAIGLALAIVFGGVGAGLLVLGRREKARAGAAATWPTVGGTVTESRIDHHTSTRRRQGRSYTSTTYTPVVDYTYQVGGRTFRGNKLFVGTTMSYDLGTAQNIANRYQAGQTATVHYDPADPTQAVLETSAGGGNFLMIIGGVFAAIGLVVLIAMGASALAP